MGNECCKDSHVAQNPATNTELLKQYTRIQEQKKKDYSNFKSYGKIKEQNNQIIANKSLRMQKYDADIASANIRLEQKIRQQTETRKDLSFQIRKIQKEIESLTKLRETEEKAIQNLKQM